MNHIYQVIWNDTAGCIQIVSEDISSSRKAGQTKPQKRQHRLRARSHFLLKPLSSILLAVSLFTLTKVSAVDIKNQADLTAVLNQSISELTLTLLNDFSLNDSYSPAINSAISTLNFNTHSPITLTGSSTSFLIFSASNNVKIHQVGDSDRDTLILNHFGQEDAGVSVSTAGLTVNNDDQSKSSSKSGVATGGSIRATAPLIFAGNYSFGSNTASSGGAIADSSNATVTNDNNTFASANATATIDASGQGGAIYATTLNLREGAYNLVNNTVSIGKSGANSSSTNIDPAEGSGIDRSANAKAETTSSVTEAAQGGGDLRYNSKVEWWLLYFDQ